MASGNGWKGKLRFGLGPAGPLGATIDPQTGLFSWTPAESQPPGKYEVIVVAEGPDGQKTQIAFTVITVRPLRFRPIEPQTVEAGKAASVAMHVDYEDYWSGKVRFSLGPDAPSGVRIDPQTGQLDWTPDESQPPGKYGVVVVAEGPLVREARCTLTIVVAPQNIALDLGSGVELEMVRIPPGEFMMGSPKADDNARSDEKPQHRVRISKPFYLGKYLVTQKQWKAVMGNNPSHFQLPKGPVENITWKLCSQFLEKLNRTRAGWAGKFGVPTEAEWEYACRAGSTTRYFFGDNESQLGEYAWYDINSSHRTHAVGEKKPNAWGLYDMHGNVAEFCRDWYYARTYADLVSAPDDPTGPMTGPEGVFRGGSWSLPAAACRSAARGSYASGLKSNFLGLRVSRNVPTVNERRGPKRNRKDSDDL